ncbi:MAG: T9SS type A sorting domain-containing protein [Bacteroidota bacterium]|nr:T9SS type A sorting domain-containing protein [Bacteroidota bacterium]
MKTSFTLLICFITVDSFAQELPLGTCGIVNIYDAVGNRTKRVYFCNNGIDPYPLRNNQQPNESEAETTAVTKAVESNEFQYVDALYPNPTTGKFYVTFSKPVTNAAISITVNNGKVLATFRGNGNKTEFDLSPYPGGMYFIRI